MMASYTCGQGGEQATEQTILQAAGERLAIVCPVHGILATIGFKPAAGTVGERIADGTAVDQLQPGKYAKQGANRWAFCPPKGKPLLCGITTTENPDTTITVKGFLDTADWRGWLENGVWLEEKR
jgi:hypothetical protein